MRISLHVESTFNLEHNRRNPEFVKKEKHIDPNGVSKIIYQYNKNNDDPNPIKTLYDDEFSDAVNVFNSNQEHKDRIIKDYYSMIKRKEDKSKNAAHLAYEMIIMIGNLEDHPSEWCCKNICLDYARSFYQRNKHMRIAGIYYHADELAFKYNEKTSKNDIIVPSTPHYHLTFVPVAEMKQGMRLQNSFNSAVQNDYPEFKGRLFFNWTKTERKILKKICEQYNLKIEDEKPGFEDHLKTREYPAYKQELDRINSEIKDKRLSIEKLDMEIEVKNNEMITTIEKNQRKIIEQEDAIESNDNTLYEQQGEILGLNEEISNLKLQYSDTKTLVRVFNTHFELLKDLYQKAPDLFNDYCKKYPEAVQALGDAFKPSLGNPEIQVLRSPFIPEEEKQKDEGSGLNRLW